MHVACLETHGRCSCCSCEASWCPKISFHCIVGSAEYYSLTLLIIGFSTSILIILISIFFLSWPFYRSFICFQFYHSILIYQILYSPIQSSFFEFLIFFLGHFVKVLLVFNFIIQFKFSELYFPIWFSLF